MIPHTCLTLNQGTTNYQPRHHNSKSIIPSKYFYIYWTHMRVKRKLVTMPASELAHLVHTYLSTMEQDFSGRLLLVSLVQSNYMNLNMTWGSGLNLPFTLYYPLLHLQTVLKAVQDCRPGKREVFPIWPNWVSWELYQHDSQLWLPSIEAKVSHRHCTPGIRFSSTQGNHCQ